MSTQSIGLMNQLGDALDAAGYTPEEITMARSDVARLKLFKEVLCGRAEITIVKRILTLTKYFDPAEFIGQGWSIWWGPADGNGLEGEEDRDIREDALPEIDLVQLVAEICLNKGESSIKGEEKLLRLKKAGKNRLGGRTFLALWQDYQEKGKDSLLEYLYQTRKLTYLDFMGLVLRSPFGNRCVLYLCRGGDGSWRWDCGWLGRVWLSYRASAGLGK